MRHIQTRLVLWFLLLSVLPTAAVGVLSYLVSGRVIWNKTNSLAAATLDQLTEKLDSRFERVNLYFDLFANTRTITETLRTTDFFAYDMSTYRAYMAIDPIFQRYLRFPSYVSGVAFYSQNGSIYNLATYFTDIETVRRSDWYRSIEAAGDRVEWLGVYPSPVLEKKGQPILIAGRSFRDLGFKGDLTNLGVLAFFIDAGAILDLPRSGQALHTICTHGDGRIVSAGGGPITRPLSDYPFGARVLSQPAGALRTLIDGEELTLIFRTMKVTGWKIIQLIPMGYYVSDLRNIGNLTIGVEMASIAAILLIAFLLARGFSRPINDLAKAFIRVGRNDLSVKVQPKVDDEIGMICHGFNDMTVRLEELFGQAVARERTLKDAELRALQYQINPHFIYNSLATVRFAAMNGNTEAVADMLLMLTRLFKNTITRTTDMVTVRETEANARDYLAIIQLQYHDTLDVSIRTDPGAADCLMPVLLLQPVVENAVLHGLSERLNLSAGDARLRIRFALDGAALRVTVHDNGSGMTAEEVRAVFESRKDLADRNVKIGLVNILERIRDRFGDPYGVEVRSEKGRYTEVELVLPRVTNGAPEAYVPGPDRR